MPPALLRPRRWLAWVIMAAAREAREARVSSASLEAHCYLSRV
jgi:hypothetical protein